MSGLPNGPPALSGLHRFFLSKQSQQRTISSLLSKNTHHQPLEQEGAFKAIPCRARASTYKPEKEPSAPATFTFSGPLLRCGRMASLHPRAGAWPPLRHVNTLGLGAMRGLCRRRKASSLRLSPVDRLPPWGCRCRGEAAYDPLEKAPPYTPP